MVIYFFSAIFDFLSQRYITFENQRDKIAKIFFGNYPKIRFFHIEPRNDIKSEINIHKHHKHCNAKIICHTLPQTCFLWNSKIVQNESSAKTGFFSHLFLFVRLYFKSISRAFYEPYSNFDIFSYFRRYIMMQI